LALSLWNFVYLILLTHQDHYVMTWTKLGVFALFSMVIWMFFWNKETLLVKPTQGTILHALLHVVVFFIMFQFLSIYLHVVQFLAICTFVIFYPQWLSFDCLVQGFYMAHLIMPSNNGLLKLFVIVATMYKTRTGDVRPLYFLHCFTVVSIPLINITGDLTSVLMMGFLLIWSCCFRINWNFVMDQET
jgi:hypothetical protein